MRRFISALILFGIALAGCTALPFHSSYKTSPDADNVFLVSMPVEETQAYQIYKGQYKDEIAKAQYLINLCRDSDICFYRNGERYTGNIAAQWLEFKLDKYFDEIKTVDDFIDNVASYSRNSGRDYIAIMPDRSRYRLKNLLHNEIDRLNNLESEHTLLSDSSIALSQTLDSDNAKMNVAHSPLQEQNPGIARHTN